MNEQGCHCCIALCADMSRRMSKVLNVAKNNSDEEVCVETKPHEIPLLAVFKMVCMRLSCCLI